MNVSAEKKESTYVKALTIYLLQAFMDNFPTKIYFLSFLKYFVQDTVEVIVHSFLNQKLKKYIIQSEHACSYNILDVCLKKIKSFETDQTLKVFKNFT